MNDKKNYFIAALVALLLISAVWGQKETGQRKKLAKTNQELQAKMESADEAVKNSALLRSEAEREKASKEQTAAQLKNAQKKIDELQAQLAAFEAKKGEQTEAAAALKAEQEQKLAALKGDKDKAAAACEANVKEHVKQLAAAQQQLAQQQAVLEEQERKLTSAAAVIKQEQKQVKDCADKLTAQEKLQSDLEELDAASKQLEEERNKILAESETMRAQVIGLERIVEERSSAQEKIGKELENCKINTNVLIAKIAELEKTPKLSMPIKKNKAEQAAPTQQ